MAVTLHTTLGDLKLEIYCDTAPRTSFNFLALCASDYYVGTLFHRNMRGFMVQGGDPTGTGKGGASVWGGAFDDEFHADNRHDRRGVLSMANKGADTNRSQFFITFAPCKQLDGKHVVFGKVVEGMSVIDKVEAVAVAPGGVTEEPTVPVVIADCGALP